MYHIINDSMESLIKYNYSSINTKILNDTILNISTHILDGGKDALSIRAKKIGYKDIFLEEENNGIDIWKNSIQINNKECDLENFKEQEFFAILEQIVNNKNNIKIVKKDNITPLGERFYEILNSELSEMPKDLD